MKRKWKVLIVALAVALLFAAAACAQAEGVLKESEEESAFGGPIAREEVRSVTFVDTLADAPSDAWDASEAGDGSVLAWAEKSGNLYDVTVGGEGGVQAADCWNFFIKFKSMEEIHFNGCFDTSGATSMRGMFWNCESLKELDLSGLDTAAVKEMDRMFEECTSLEKLDLSGFDTHNVTNMYGMFMDCSSLEELDLSGFDTSNADDMTLMFYSCEKLSELDLRSFDTSKVKSMAQMFMACRGLAELDLTGFDTGKVEDMHRMFNYTDALESIYASDKFVIGANTDTTDMFAGCRAGKLTYTSAPAAGEEEPTAEGEAPAEGEVPAEAKAPAGDYETLQRGDKGTAVAKFQAKLVEHNYLADVADGDFGGKTEAAVKQLQADAGLEQTGIADAATQAALENLTAEFEPKGNFTALLYWGEYDADAQNIAWYVKNTGKYEINGFQFVLQQCDASKAGLGDFNGNRGRNAVNVYPLFISEHIQPGETHTFRINEVTDSAFFSESAYVSVFTDVVTGVNENGDTDGEKGDKKKIYIPLG